MKVILAEKAGFCFGVKRAMDLVYERIRTGPFPIYTYGPMIHNEEVVEDLKRRGVVVIYNPEELSGLTEGTIVIRSHGVTKELYDRLAESPLTVVDATCPYVQKIHRHAYDFSKQGYRVLIVGNASHPEVSGICGWCTHSRPVVIETAEDAERFESNSQEKIAVIVQTTYNSENFKVIVDILNNKTYNVTVCNTICNATRERQLAAESMAGSVDACIVIGGRNSSNSQKLYEICSKKCANTFYIQTSDDLNINDFRNFQCVGITAGASTPNYIIEEVQGFVRKKF